MPDPRKVRHARLPDQLDAQVHVGLPPGLDGAGEGRGLQPPRRGPFHEAVFIHASTSPNQQIIAIARRGAAPDGAGRLRTGHERRSTIALRSAATVNAHPLISKYFRVLGADDMIPAEYRASGFKDFLAPGTELGRRRSKAMREDEFYLDPTRMTLVCGTAGFDGTQFKGMLARTLQHPDQQDLAQQRAAADQHQQHAQRRRAADQGAAGDLRARSRTRLAERRRDARGGVRGAGEGADGRTCPTCRTSAASTTPSARTRASDAARATCAPRSSCAYDEADCEYVPLTSPRDRQAARRTGRSWSRPTSSFPIRPASRSWCRGR